MAWERVRKTDIDRLALLETVLQLTCPMWPHLKCVYNNWHILGTAFTKESESAQVFIDKDGRLAYRTLAMPANVVNVVTLEQLAKKFRFEAILSWLYNDVRPSGQEAYQGVRDLHKEIQKSIDDTIVRHYVSMVPLSLESTPLPEQVCITDTQFSFERVDTGTRYAHDVVVASFASFCPRHQDDRCEGKARFKDIPVADASVLGENVFLLRTDPGVYAGHATFPTFCPDYTCGISYRLPARGYEELVAAASEFLIAKGKKYELR